MEVEYYGIFGLAWSVSQSHPKCFRVLFGSYLLACVIASCDLVGVTQPTLAWFTAEQAMCVGNPTCILAYLPIFVLGTVMGAHWTAMQHLPKRILNIIAPILMAGLLLSTIIGVFLRGMFPALEFQSTWLPVRVSYNWLGVTFVPQAFYHFTFVSPFNLVFVFGLIASAAISVPSLDFLQSKPFMFLGEISFGLYVLHPVVGGLMYRTFDGTVGTWYILLYFGASILVAWASNCFFEKPVGGVVKWLGALVLKR